MDSWLRLVFSLRLAVLYRDSADVRGTFAGMPVRISLPGNASEVETPEFIARGGRSYDVEIVRSATGLNLQQDNLSWALLEHEHIVAHKEVVWELSSDGDDAIIGSFRPEHDGHYKLRVDTHDRAVSPVATQADLIVIPDMGERDERRYGWRNSRICCGHLLFPRLDGTGICDRWGYCEAAQISATSPRIRESLTNDWHWLVCGDGAFRKADLGVFSG